MIFDIRTLAMIATLFALLSAFAKALVLRNSPALKGAATWPAGAALIAVGMILIDFFVWMFAATMIFAIVTIRRLSRASEEIHWGTDVGTWEWNVQTGETRFNDHWFEIVGYEPRELQPVNIETWNSLAHPTDLLRSAAALEKHFAGETAY